mmetsp:Transcript_29659/g.98171  ORF Transcript_29659/g.98171 Transcript_29659/m.98171 type:complete len:254 (+) Transcript_29659:129-890(+)
MGLRAAEELREVFLEELLRDPNRFVARRVVLRVLPARQPHADHDGESAVDASSLDLRDYDGVHEVQIIVSTAVPKGAQEPRRLSDKRARVRTRQRVRRRRRAGVQQLHHGGRGHDGAVAIAPQNSHFLLLREDFRDEPFEESRVSRAIALESLFKRVANLQRGRGHGALRVLRRRRRWRRDFGRGDALLLRVPVLDRRRRARLRALLHGRGDGGRGVAFVARALLAASRGGPLAESRGLRHRVHGVRRLRGRL